MTYEEALAWLYARRRTGERGTHRVRALLARLGHPEAGFLAVHVLGTNGKGSVVAYLGPPSAPRASPTGPTPAPTSWTSERGSAPTWGPSPGRRWSGSWPGRGRRPGRSPRASLTWPPPSPSSTSGRGGGAGRGGGGGRGEKDATNALSRVALTVLTNVGEDHLGPWGVPSGPWPGRRRGPSALGCRWSRGRGGWGWRWPARWRKNGGRPFTSWTPRTPSSPFPPRPASGAYQEENARLAAAALRLLGLPEAAIARGLREARHPGRMERFLLKGVEVYLDGAHNPPAAEALAREFSAYHLVFGAFPRKDVKGVLAHLLPKARSVRYARAGEGALGGELGTPFFEDPWEALEDALARAREDGLPVLATGSLYLVGRLRERLVAGLGEDLP